MIARCGRTDPHGAHWRDVAPVMTRTHRRRVWCAGNVNIVTAVDSPTALDLWRQWYALEDRRPAGTVGDAAYDAWTAECARIYTLARAADACAY